MSLGVEAARRLQARLDDDRLRALFAQAHAKFVLREVGEDPENFPNFEPNLEERVTFASYALMHSGIAMVEAHSPEGRGVIERASTNLYYVHRPDADARPDSAFNVLVAAMGLYAAGHYSRAFVALKQVEAQTQAGRLIGAFIRKSWVELATELANALESKEEFDSEVEVDEWGITLAISRALTSATHEVLSGSAQFEAAERFLFEGERIASAGMHAAWWWVLKLLRLMLSDLSAASLWNVLPPYFGPDAADALGDYVRALAFDRRPVIELWESQRAAIGKALDGAQRAIVVSLRTSAGKTRVAELAILKTLLDHPGAKVLYLAPFRSLAAELEATLSSTFGILGFRVSQLYGGARVSQIDLQISAEAPITIATPEKARALLRAAPEVFAQIRLVVVDEGHLIGASERYVRNEIFLDHLRAVAAETGARILLLSAVLPNADEIATWIGGAGAVPVTSTWRPSLARFGLLRWNGDRVKLEWQGGVASFNPSFVRAGDIAVPGRKKPFPADKNEAVAATAVRLASIGPTMIFTARAVSVPVLAKAVLAALGSNAAEFEWPAPQWRVFAAVAEEELEEGAVELKAARMGVICHSNRLMPQVRTAMETLMRSRPPFIVIATTTLGQGVNIGISSVIIANPIIDQHNTVTTRDFWNICGRAGRAYVDGEGKLLYAVDDTKKPWQISKAIGIAQSYFAGLADDPVESGLLFVLSLLSNAATAAGISFEQLLEIVANNDLGQLQEQLDAEPVFDLIDDQLFAMHEDEIINPFREPPALWVERVFRASLASIQAAKHKELSSDQVVRLLAARGAYALKAVGDRPPKMIVASGLPLRAALAVLAKAADIAQLIDRYAESLRSIDDLVSVIGGLEDVLSKSVAGCSDFSFPAPSEGLQRSWLSAVPTRKLLHDFEDAAPIIREYYGYQLPWLIHGVAQQFANSGDEERSQQLSSIALLVELGLPTQPAALVFLAGVRSRRAASEIAAIDFPLGNSVSEVRASLRDANVIATLKAFGSEVVSAWLDLLSLGDGGTAPAPMPMCTPFKLTRECPVSVLHCRSLNGRTFLASSDGQFSFAVQSNNQFPFEQLSNDPRVVFVRDEFDTWTLQSRDPRLWLLPRFQFAAY